MQLKVKVRKPKLYQLKMTLEVRVMELSHRLISPEAALVNLNNFCENLVED